MHAFDGRTKLDIRPEIRRCIIFTYQMILVLYLYSDLESIDCYTRYYCYFYCGKTTKRDSSALYSKTTLK
jgi:hypothetical protein